MMNAWSLILIAALLLQLLSQWLLATRHVRCLRAHRERVPPPFEDRIPLAAHRKAADYCGAKARLQLAEYGYAAAILLAVTLGGGLQSLDRAWRALGWPELALGTAFLLSAMLIRILLDVPLEYYRSFRLEQRFGFNRMTPRLYASDLAKQILLTLALGAPLTAGLLALMQGAGGNPWWWLHLWLAWMAFGLFMTWAWPVLFAPLFNKFRPLQDAGLQQRIERLLERNGFSSRGVFVMDGSARSTHGNAYFTGLGAAKRIVFFDTLTKELGADEIEAVLAHELGHFKRRHIGKRFAILALLSLAGAAALGQLAGSEWFYHGLGVERPSAHQALALFALAAPVFLYFLQPAFAALSRRHEFEADDFAVEQVPGGALQQALVKLYRDNANTLTPDPWYSAFHDSHPPAPTRIAHLARLGARTAPA